MKQELYTFPNNQPFWRRFLSWCLWSIVLIFIYFIVIVTENFDDRFMVFVNSIFLLIFILNLSISFLRTRRMLINVSCDHDSIFVKYFDFDRIKIEKFLKKNYVFSLKRAFTWTRGWILYCFSFRDAEHELTFYQSTYPGFSYEKMEEIRTMILSHK